MQKNSEYKGIMILAEFLEDNLHDTTLELLGEGKRLANLLHTEVSVLVIAENARKWTEVLFEYGADMVILVENKTKEYLYENIYTNILKQVVEQRHPDIILIGATQFGRSIAPSLASSLGTGLTADCTSFDIDIEKGLLIQKRPAFGGKLMATIVCPDTKPQMATVRPKTMMKLDRVENRKGFVLQPKIRWPSQSSLRLMNSQKTNQQDYNLADSNIIIGVGKGIGNAKNLEAVFSLARELHATVGATRGVIEEGWLDYSYQIGQTGKIISPEIYITCGISGAVQHLMGVNSSNTIISINNDPNAPIFNVSDYAIVGDIEAILPTMHDIINDIKLSKLKLKEIV